MKQETNEPQTAKLIELGFVPKPRIKEVRTVHSKVVINHDCNFTIGELIEMLPEAICTSDDNIHYVFTTLHVNGTCFYLPITLDARNIVA